MSPCVLYQEVIDLCIDFLDDSDAGYTALCKCLLVSHSFLQRSRPRGFSTLHVYTDTNANHATSWVIVMERTPLLLRLLEYSYPENSLPQLASCVNALVLDYTNPIVNQQIGFDASYGDLSAIFSLLRDRSNIQSFTLKILAVGRFPPVIFPRHLEGDLHNLLYMPSMKAITLHGIVKLPLSLLGGPALKQLEIKRASMTFDGLVGDECLPRLHSLSCLVSGLPGELPLRYAQSGTTQLQQLRFLKTAIPYPYNFQAALRATQWILDNSHSSLETFTFQFHCPGINPLPFNLGKLSVIRNFCWVVIGGLGLDSAGKTHMTFDGIDLITNSLASLTNVPRSLQEIKISLQCYCGDGVILSGIRNEDMNHWRVLDALLTGPDLQSLNRIQISVKVQRSSSESVAILPFTATLPILMSGVWKDSRFNFTSDVTTTDLVNIRDI